MIEPDSFAATFRAIDNFWDTTDFTVLYLLNLWYGYGDVLAPATRDAIAQRFLTFKYWYTEPTPAGLVDHKWYWSENHRIIFHVDEYLAGHAFPDATFTNDGRTGAAHAQVAETRIRGWLDEKVRFGFTEWHSDVYYQKDVTPLLTLVEFAPDRDLAARAAMVLDLVFLDVALHLQHGNFGATHGRSYMKDKSTARRPGDVRVREDRCSTTPPSRTNLVTTRAARCSLAHGKYRVPDVIVQIARSDEPLVDTERMNVPLDPFAPVTAEPGGTRRARVHRPGEHPVLVGARRAQHLAAPAHDDRDARPTRTVGQRLLLVVQAAARQLRRRHGRGAFARAHARTGVELRPA